MEAQLNKNMKMAKMKERLKAKQEQKQEQAQALKQGLNQEQTQIPVSEEELLKIFSTGEKVEKTPRGTKPPPPKGKKVKKGKK